VFYTPGYGKNADARIPVVLLGASYSYSGYDKPDMQMIERLNHACGVDDVEEANPGNCSDVYAF
jgi:hypothetical protein